MITNEFKEVWNALFKWGCQPVMDIKEDGTPTIWVIANKRELDVIAALANFPQILVSYSKEQNETYHIIKGVEVTLTH